MKRILERYTHTSLMIRIVIGLAAGAALGFLFPGGAILPVFGSLFVGALKGIAPILVFVLVISSLVQGETGFDSRFGKVIALYLISTLLAGIVAVLASFLFPLTIKLTGAVDVSAAPSGIGEVLRNLLVSMVSNPVEALASGNYISILFWAVLFGVILKSVAKDTTKQVLDDISTAVSTIVGWVIQLAPFLGGTTKTEL